MDGSLIYFDHNATTQLKGSIAESMFDYSHLPGNASSIHSFGRKSKRLIEEARLSIATALGIDELDNYRIIFTASGSESNNLAINSFKNHLVITSRSEHLSILNAVKTISNVKYVDINNDGLVDLNNLEQILANYSGPKLVSIIFANNETGVIQDIEKIAQLSHNYGAMLHSDITQIIGKIDINFKQLNLDLATISAHKFGGPQGAACLIAKKNITINPLILGGGQEQGARAGTENILAIHGFGMAAKLLSENLDKVNEIKYLRDYIEKNLANHAIIVAGNITRLGNTSCLIMPHVSSETQLINFDLSNIALSAGSACSSGKISVSHVLKSYGYSDDLASCAIRVSLGLDNNLQQADRFISAWLEIYNRLSKNHSKLSA
jgi:cysteine desulfurase